MALPLSGLAKEDVELLLVETADFSLVIKGKPYHERYQGFQQYRSLDYHDAMFLDIEGKAINEVKVFDVSRQLLVEPGEQHRPIFFENGIYQVMVSPKSELELNFYHEHPLLRKAIDRVNIGRSYVLLGNLQFQSEIGYSTFEIKCGNETLLQITIEIFPTKLDYKEDYRKLLDEVNDEIYNLAFHFLKKTYLSAKIKLEGNPSLAEFFRLLSFYFDSFIKSIKQIERYPHHKLEKQYEVTRGDRIKNVDSRGRNYLRKNAHLMVPVNQGIQIGTSSYMPVKGLTFKKEITYDTHENRYIKYMMKRIVWKIDDLYRRYVNSSNRFNKNQTQEEDEIKAVLVDWKFRLEQKLNSTFWKSIGTPDRMISSLVLQLAPGYREAYKIFLTLSKGLTLQSSIHKMSVKDVATLYEYWTYLKLGQILRRKYVLVNQDIIKVNRDGLYVNLEANKQATRIYKHPITNEEISLIYQKYEGPLPTISQRPDTMLSIEKKGESYSFNYIFDAKYRIDFAASGSYYERNYTSPGPMEEDINTMHRYRDSIVSEKKGPYERTAFGAYVLFPWNEEVLFQEHHFYKSLEKVNIGAFPFLPNATNLVERFVENLIEKSPEELQKEGILPRGSLEKWKQSIEEKVFVGVVSKMEQYQDALSSATYRIPITHLRRGWQEAVYIALYLTKEVGKTNGIFLYGKISHVNFENGNAVFKVDCWIDLPNVIVPVNYGIATYILTTFQSLLSAKELPELFMKSEEERLIWQALRRISDRIKIGLDKPNLDEAGQIANFRIKDITLSFQDEKVLVNKRNGEVNEIEIKDIKDRTTNVFKMLVKELEK
jgi:uncharacterized protein